MFSTTQITSDKKVRPSLPDSQQLLDTKKCWSGLSLSHFISSHPHSSLLSLTNILYWPRSSRTSGGIKSNLHWPYILLSERPSCTSFCTCLQTADSKYWRAGNSMGKKGHWPSQKHTGDDERRMLYKYPSCYRHKPLKRKRKPAHGFFFPRILLLALDLLPSGVLSPWKSLHQGFPPFKRVLYQREISLLSAGTELLPKHIVSQRGGVRVQTSNNWHEIRQDIRKADSVFNFLFSNSRMSEA